MEEESVKRKTQSVKLRMFIILFLIIAGCQVPAVYATVSGRSRQSADKPVWKIIVIHHSATVRGNASMFEKYHNSKGMQNGLAYHFVIDNGTCGKRDGQLEIGERWNDQLPGGHCRQQWVNETGIGICLVGNFNRTRPTPKQMRTLVNLVKKLQEKYNIPIKHVAGHGKIKGEKSQCPGRYFPWSDFYADLRGAE